MPSVEGLDAFKLSLSQHSIGFSPSMDSFSWPLDDTNQIGLMLYPWFRKMIVSCGSVFQRSRACVIAST